MKNVRQAVTIILFLFICKITLAQGTPIPQANYTIQSVSAQNGTNVATRSIDNDTTTFWATDVNPTLPVTIELDLGVNYDVNGFSILPKTTSNNNKPLGYELYLSNNGIAWGTVEAAGTMTWANNADLGIRKFFFGAISARYVKIVYLAGTAGNNNIQTSEILIYESPTVPTGQANQVLTFNSIAKHFSSDAPFMMSSVVSSGLPITYAVISGPATVMDSTITLTGTGGAVLVKAEQVGDASFYPVSFTRSFDVVDLATINPAVSTKLTGSYPIEMPVLNAYPIYVSATIDEPTQLSISNVEFEIDGAIVPAYIQNGYYLGWWKPSATGNFDVYIKATGSNGNITADTVNVDVTNAVVTQNVQTFNGDLVSFNIGGGNRTFNGSYTLPQSIGAYDQIIANFSVTCPAINGGCDDWDRLAYAEYKAPDGTWMELFRYITPYGVACNHSIDVTDYASLLHGNTEIRMFIDTWGTGGWDVHLDFDYIKGTPDHLYSSIQEVWHGSYNFGNPSNLQPCDTVSIVYPDNTQKVTFRLTSSGHGWGSNNTGNAAEFYEATHNFHVNGVPTYSQHLWNDCNPNPDNCTGQQGSWTFNRAGWCPGIIAPPNIYDLTSQIGNAPFDLAYVFQQSYQDNCHPNNPSCVTGVTCGDCNAGFNPFYRVGGYMISFSNSPISSSVIGVEEELGFEIDLFPNPNNGVFKMNISREIEEVAVTINDITGTVVKTYFINGKSEFDAYEFDVSSLSKGTYFINVKTQFNSTVKKVILN